MTRELIQQRADEFEELAHSLQKHAQNLRSHLDKPEAEPGRLHWPNSIGDLDKMAAALITGRTQRLRHLDGSLLGEPGWEILLLLFSYYKAEERLTLDQLCQSSSTNPATARRWISVLVMHGLVEIDDSTGRDKVLSAQLTELGKIRIMKILIDFQGEYMPIG